MKFKALWTNYKIYAFILGIVAGTLVYNLIGIDFSFSMYKQIAINDFWKSFIYFFICNVRFLIVIFVISFFDIKRKILPLIIFYQAFVLAGLITIIISTKSGICFYAMPSTLIKIMAAIFMFDDSKPVINRIISSLIIITGTALENFFIIYFWGIFTISCIVQIGCCAYIV